jgi:hypothetical protein
MQEIWKIKKSFTKGLSAIHHQRVNYAEKINQVRQVGKSNTLSKGYIQPSA